MDKAILITYDKADALDEAIGLCDAAGYSIIHTIKQNFLKRPKYGISAGILEDLKDVCEKLDPDVIIYDEILKPVQNYNLASSLRREILDRETLILEIFEKRASSAESKLQVKLAQLRYEMARAKEKVRLSSMGEQPGFMGIGKFGVDVYYNDIKHRMQSVRTKLEKAGKQRELHRQGRKRLGFKTISLAGYTSAGKTTLFNKITGQSHPESGELFTTLSTTTRRMTIQREPFLISDTVGFISKLPAYMIDAFRSTLEELIHTDVVIVTVDISDSIYDIAKKFKSSMRTLSEIGVEQDRIIFALNKADLLEPKEIQERVDILNLDGRKHINVSARTGQNITELKEMIRNIISNQKVSQPSKQQYRLQGQEM
ncbi:MAG: GTPase HflX [Thaumarchaeota archaeon]|nr:GTPase HflX [Nitrososphaerota archaeon]